MKICGCFFSVVSLCVGVNVLSSKPPFSAEAIESPFRLESYPPCPNKINKLIFFLSFHSEIWNLSSCLPVKTKTQNGGIFSQKVDKITQFWVKNAKFVAFWRHEKVGQVKKKVGNLAPKRGLSLQNIIETVGKYEQAKSSH